MKRLFKTLSALFLMSTLMTIPLNAQEKQNLDPFPAAKDGMVRHVIDLPKKSDESKLKVEIIPGKMMLVDCNIYNLSGNIEEKDLEGWGYTYYEFITNGNVASTRKACNAPKVNKFVTGHSVLVNYNSRLPIVVYAPVGYDIKYSVWKAGKEEKAKVK